MTPIDRLRLYLLTRLGGIPASARPSPPPMIAGPRQADSVASAITGLGVLGSDKARDAAPASPSWLAAEQMDAQAVTSEIIRRAIFGIPEDSVSGGFRVDSDDARDITRDLDHRLDLERHLVHVDQSARQYGGAHWLVVCRGVSDLSRPLPPGPHEIEAIHVIEGRESVPILWDREIQSPHWTDPLTWQITINRAGGFSVPGLGNVHRSHLVYMSGLPLSRSQWVPMMIGKQLSVPQAYWEAVRDLGLAHRSTAIAAMEQSMMTLRLRGGQTVLSGSEDSSAADALSLWSQSRSILRTNVLTGEDEASRLEAPLVGLADIVRVQYERLSAVEGIPLSVLLGMAPGGLSTDDAAGRRTYARLIERRRRTRLAPFLRRFYDLALGEGPTREVVWSEVDKPTPQERAQTSLLLAQRDAALVAAGIITPDEARARYATDSDDDELELPVLVEDDLGDDLDVSLDELAALLGGAAVAEE